MSEGWDAKAEELDAELAKIGINFAGSSVATQRNAEYGNLDELSRAT